MKILRTLLALPFAFAIALFMTSCGGDDSDTGSDSDSNSDGGGSSDGNGGSAAAEPTISDEAWGTADGAEVKLFTLTNAEGVTVKITNYGGTVTTILVPTENGEMVDVALGYESLEKYLEGSPYFGCITGRYANRIKHGKFTIDGTEYQLARNNGGENNDENHLHGGVKGFDKIVWTVDKAEVTDAGPTLVLSHTSPDGDEGYPGELKMVVVYTLTADNGLQIDYSAQTDKPTVINLTNHTYFNLSGEGSEQTILDHELQIFASKFTPTDNLGIPTGIATLDGSPLDFRQSTPIGQRIGVEDEQLMNGIGYDHNYVLDGGATDNPRHVATVRSPRTGIVLEVLTDQPGLQFYCGNYLDGSNIGKSGKAYQYRTGFCLEAQVFPDSPNQHETEGYTSALLKPGETYTQTTIYRFRAD